MFPGGNERQEISPKNLSSVDRCMKNAWCKFECKCCSEGRHGNTGFDTNWPEPQIKDSGIDTGHSSSSQTINEEGIKVFIALTPEYL